MNYTTTVDAPVSPVVEPLDELTQAEMERMYRLARDLKRGKIGRVTIDPDAVRSGKLYIVGWKRAA